ncbi:hypothetical protein ATK17_2411 [Branchiibius hedensis]|uniref:Uncharacterized protein n=1 Tax=Branchiibius hedensis TaxID=672460 RepID=A0A2Y8ZU89_9MICO|nr:hypothetical protein [Branchiibius hedensis]PWJ26264.1 hypothetical protein ATK17_2411 [Branchiibius hedensis]SSA35076.1 hypothetical protein SAMN04489750_2411 [Branchiibius hedensis]
MFRNRVFAVCYWLIAIALAVAGGVWGASLLGSRSPEFHDDGNGVVASSASHVLFEILGGVLGAAIVLAIASLIWFFLWWRDRQDGVGVDEDDSDLSLDDVDEMMVDEDEPYSDEVFDVEAEPALPQDGTGRE